jgi:type VI protein secretion system component VasK
VAYRFLTWLAKWEVQAVVMGAIGAISLLLLLLACLRFFPHVRALAIARKEPFWVLILSIAALIIAVFGSIPAVLALRELQEGRERKATSSTADI